MPLTQVKLHGYWGKGGSSFPHPPCPDHRERAGSLLVLKKNLHGFKAKVACCQVERRYMLVLRTLHQYKEELYFHKEEEQKLGVSGEQYLVKTD